jgi:hypothetical protein
MHCWEPGTSWVGMFVGDEPVLLCALLLPI